MTLIEQYKANPESVINSPLTPLLLTGKLSFYDLLLLSTLPSFVVFDELSKESEVTP